MKKYKIHFTVICTIFIISSLCACSKNNPPTTPDSTNDSSLEYTLEDSRKSMYWDSIESAGNNNQQGSLNENSDKFYSDNDSKTDYIMRKVQNSPILSFYNAVLEDIIKTYPEYLNSSEIFIVNINQLPAMSSDDINTFVSYFKNYYSLNIRNLKEETQKPETNEIIIKIKEHDLSQSSCKLSLSISKKNKDTLNLSYSAAINLVQNTYKIDLTRKG